MKESLQSPWKAPIFKVGFNDAFSVVKQGGNIVGGVTFLNGVATTNGTNSYIYYNSPFKGTYSIRVKIKPISITNKYICDFRTSSGTGFVYFDGVNNVSASSGTVYINGVAGTVPTVNEWNEIVVAGIALDATRVNISSSYTLSLSANDFELLEIYDYTLTANEVLNLYQNKRYVSPLMANEILNVDARDGVIANKWNSALTNTAVSVVKSGSIYAMDFNGTSSKLDLGTYNTLVGDKTVRFWVNLKGFGSSEIGGIIGNDKFRVSTRGSANNRLYFYSDGSTFAASAVGSLVLRRWIMVCATRTSAGVTNIYINGALSGTANQSSGTPAAGTANITVGLASSLYGNCLLSNISIENEILSAQTISQLFSSEHKFYNV